MPTKSVTIDVQNINTGRLTMCNEVFEDRGADSRILISRGYRPTDLFSPACRETATVFDVSKGNDVSTCYSMQRSSSSGQTRRGNMEIVVMETTPRGNMEIPREM